MNQEELLSLYIEKLRDKTMDILEEDQQKSVLEALKRALAYLEGEMSGY